MPVQFVLLRRQASVEWCGRFQASAVCKVGGSDVIDPFAGRKSGIFYTLNSEQASLVS